MPVSLPSEVADWPFIPVVPMNGTSSCWVLSRGKWTEILCLLGLCPRIDEPSCEASWAELQGALPPEAHAGLKSELRELAAAAYNSPLEDEIRDRMVAMGKISPFLDCCSLLMDVIVMWVVRGQKMVQIEGDAGAADKEPTPGDSK